jgi:hypothetical protein
VPAAAPLQLAGNAAVSVLVGTVLHATVRHNHIYQCQELPRLVRPGSSETMAKDGMRQMWSVLNCSSYPDTCCTVLPSRISVTLCYGSLSPDKGGARVSGSITAVQWQSLWYPCTEHPIRSSA